MEYYLFRYWKGLLLPTTWVQDCAVCQPCSCGSGKNLPFLSVVVRSSPSHSENRKLGFLGALDFGVLQNPALFLRGRDFHFQDEDGFRVWGREGHRSYAGSQGEPVAERKMVLWKPVGALSFAEESWLSKYSILIDLNLFLLVFFNIKYVFIVLFLYKATWLLLTKLLLIFWGTISANDRACTFSSCVAVPGEPFPHPVYPLWEGR